MTRLLILPILFLLVACGDQEPKPIGPAKPGDPITEKEIGRDDLTPPEKKDCKILGVLCR